MCDLDADRRIVGDRFLFGEATVLLAVAPQSVVGCVRTWHPGEAEDISVADDSERVGDVVRCWPASVHIDNRQRIRRRRRILDVAHRVARDAVKRVTPPRLPDVVGRRRCRAFDPSRERTRILRDKDAVVE